MQRGLVKICRCHPRMRGTPGVRCFSSSLLWCRPCKHPRGDARRDVIAIGAQLVSPFLNACDAPVPSSTSSLQSMYAMRRGHSMA